jgi:hypothetical protein
MFAVDLLSETDGRKLLLTTHNQNTIMKKTVMFIALAAAFGFNNAQAVDWNWKGDVRYRYQSEMADRHTGADDHSRDRHRLRVRLGVNPWINEELSAGLRLTTDSAESTSRNQSLDNGFNTKNIVFDEAYVNFHPMSLSGAVNLLLGKREVSSTLFIEKDLVWDTDLTFEGVTLQYGKEIDGKQKDGLGAVAGWYSLDENKSVTTKEQDAYLIVLQGCYKGNLSDFGYDFGAGYYDFVHFDFDNSTAQSGFEPKFDYRGKDFNIVEFFGGIGGDITETVPWKLYGQYAFNTASKKNAVNIDESQRDAWLAGLKIGSAKNPGQIEGAVEYVNIEKDAVTAMTDSDRNYPDSDKTNIRGWKLNAVYHLVQNMTVGATYMNFKEITGTDNDRNHLLQADVVVKF